MTKTTDLLDAAKAAAGCDTDYQFAKRYKLTVQTVSNWRQGKSTFSDDYAEMIARILGKEPGEVMALCQAERAKSEPARARWLRVAALLAAIITPPAASGGVDNNAVQNANYAKLRKALRRMTGGDLVLSL